MCFVSRHPKSIAIFVILGALILLLAMGIVSKTDRAIAPPIYDPLGYIQKAHSISQSIHEGRIVNPLDADPTFRPPGFVPFSYPFGYSSKINSYLFWTTFSPIVLWLLALWLALKRQIHASSDSWTPLSICAGLLTLPMFYHFEMSPAFETVDLRWGMQDCLLASLAALAVSLMALSVQTRNITATVIAWLLSGYTLLVKPSGSLVMLIIAGIWFVEIFAARKSDASRKWKRSLSKYTVITGALGVVTYAIILSACMSSKYLSASNIAIASNASRILRILYSDSSSLRLGITYVGATIGWEWFVPLALLMLFGLGEAVVNVFRGSVSAANLKVFSGLIILFAACLWWVALAGMQVRYYFPFVLIVIVWLLPEALPSLRRLPVVARVLVSAYCFAIYASLIVMLLMNHSPIRLQQALGYNLSSGGYGNEVATAKRMIAEARATGKPMTIYSSMGWSVGVILSIDYLELINSGQPFAFQWIGPLDWIREPGIRFSDLTKVDYILQEKQTVSPLADSSTIGSYGEELRAYSIWVESLGKHDGVQKEDDGRLLALRIVDRNKLEESFRHFAARFVWRDIFVKNNPELFQGK